MHIADAAGDFFQALRQEGLPLGVREVERLYRIANLQPEMDWQQAHDTLCCLLVKTPQQRERFEALFDAWCPEETQERQADDLPDDDVDDSELEHRDETPATTRSPGNIPIPPDASGERLKQPETATEQQSWWASRWPWLAQLSWRLGVVAAVGTVAVVVLAWLALQRDTSSGWPVIVFGVCAWLVTLLIWVIYLRNGLPPAVQPSSEVLWLPLAPPNTTGLALLEPPDIRRMVWNIGRFVSEELTPKLDLARTTAATARAGGQVVLHYQPAIYPREVWLWLDEATEDSSMRRVAAELQYTLERAGLPCRQGWFQDVPDPVVWTQTQRFSPLSVEGHRQHVLVVILSNGRGMTLVHDLATKHISLVQLLHGLAEWPQLAFVDVSYGAYNLAVLLQGYGLRCLAPEEVPAFLGAQDVGVVPLRQPALIGALKTWAAGLALAPEPVDESSAHALRQALQLPVAAWGLAGITACGREEGRGYAWPLPQRAAWLHWLLTVEGVEQAAREGADPKELRGHSRLGRMLDFWRQRYIAAEARYKEQKSQAAYRFTVYRAVLDLWCDPDAAATTLFEIYQSDAKALQTLIRQQLCHLASIDTALPQGVVCIRLPWRQQDCLDITRWMLHRMGFASGAEVLTGPLRLSGTVALLLGWCVGIGSVALAFGGTVGSVLIVLCTAAAYVTYSWYERQHRLDEETPDLVPMIDIPGGTFWMGSADDDEQAYGDEKPRHQVTVSAFRMSQYLITRDVYRKIMQADSVRVRWKRRRWWQRDDRMPANDLTWFEAVMFCNALSEQQGLTPCYQIDGEAVHWDRQADGYRLPTEAEWEYAARAGTLTRWFCGDTSEELGRYAWFDVNAEDRVHPVGSKAANPWGLYDMAGNVYEWCWDWYVAYTADAMTDPTGPDSGSSRVLRGGAYCSRARNLRSADRYGNQPEDRGVDVGLRVARRPRRQP